MEFADERQSESMVLYYTNEKPKIRNKDVYVQFSNHKELKTDVQNPYQVSISDFDKFLFIQWSQFV